MKKFFVRFSVLISSIALVASCNKSSTNTGGGTALTAGGTAAKAVITAVNLDNMLPTATTAAIDDMTGNQFETFAGGLSTVWELTTHGFQNEKTATDTATSMKQFMGIQLDDNAYRTNGSSINVFGRIKNAAMIACIIMTASSASTSASLVGTSSTITMDSATLTTLTSTCGISTTTQTQISGQSFPLVHTAPSSATTFDLKTAITMPTAMGGGTQYVYLKWGAGADVAIAANEDNNNGRTRTIVTYNSTTKILKAEYISKSKGTGFNLTVHRLYKDEITGVARIFTQIRSNFTTATADDPSSNLSYVLDGNTIDSTATANLNFAINYTMAPSGTYEACVKKSDGVVQTDPVVTTNTFTCTNSGGTGGRATAYVTAVLGAASPGTAINGQTISATPTWHDFANAPSLLWSTPDTMLTTGI